jgi:hypothetical protein
MDLEHCLHWLHSEPTHLDGVMACGLYDVGPRTDGLPVYCELVVVRMYRPMHTTTMRIYVAYTYTSSGVIIVLYLPVLRVSSGAHIYRDYIGLVVVLCVMIVLYSVPVCSPSYGM